MKKIISLLASVAMLATMVTSVSAASIATNAPVVSATIEEIDADAFLEFTEEDLEEGNVAYLITADFTGLDLINQPGGDTNGDGKVSTAEKKARTGVLVSAAEFGIEWDSEANIVAVYDELREIVEVPGFLDQTGEVYGLASYNSVADFLPKAATSATEEATELRGSSYVVVTDGTPVTGTVNKAALVIRETVNGSQVDMKNYDIDMGNIGIEVNGEDTNVVTLGEEGGDDPIVPDEPKEMEVKVKDDKRFALDINDDAVADGYAWEVLVTNYDSTKTVSAKFTDAETGATRAGKEKTEITGLAPIAEANGGSVSFVALLRLSQARNVNMEIVVE